MDIWIDLQRAAREHNGKTIETTLLGKVLPIRRPSGLTGYIPDCLQKTAANYGLVIEAALWKEGSYVLRAAAHNAKVEADSRGFMREVAPRTEG